MSDATERTKQAEADYKKGYAKRQVQRLNEQKALKLVSQKKQKAQETKALKRKIAKRRAK